MSFMERQLRKRGKLISIQTRTIKPVNGASVDMSLDFAEKHEVKALIATPRGSVLFDGVGVDQPVTHKFTIIYIADITAEDWIIFGGNKFDIIDVENCGECDKFLLLRCKETGKKEASKA